MAGIWTVLTVHFPDIDLSIYRTSCKGGIGYLSHALNYGSFLGADSANTFLHCVWGMLDIEYLKPIGGLYINSIPSLYNSDIQTTKKKYDVLERYAQHYLK